MYPGATARGPTRLVIPLLLSVFATTAQGAGHRIIKAKVRTDAYLPCEAPEGSDLDDLVLEWTRPDLHPDYVFLFRGGRPLDDSQHPHFRNRVQLSDPTLLSGDLALNLLNIRHTDTGMYHCHIFVPPLVRTKRSQLGTEPIRTVELIVVNPVRHFVKAEVRTDVYLPCEAPEGSNLNDLVLKWTRDDLRQDYVFLFRDGRSLDDSQHPHFRNRVELSDPTLLSRNLTLKLLDVRHTDNGTYHCHIFVPPRNRTKRSQLGTEPIRTVDLIVVNPEPKDKDFHRTLQSGAIPFEAGIGYVATLFIMLFLQMWE